MPKFGSKLIIISMRLPVTVKKQDGKLSFSPSQGGLATGVSSLRKSKDSVWVGWPGIASDKLTPNEKKQIVEELKKHRCYPIFLTQDQIDGFYSGYSNSTIWPLFHYFPNKTRYESEFWQCYKKVNDLFARESIKFRDNGSVFWIHDYQLMLVPAMLRKIDRSLAIGFFLHIPFPSFEIFRLLPERKEIIRGLLGSNLIGFHTYDYVRHFLSSALRLLGAESTLGVVKYRGHRIKVDAFPISIDYKKFAKGTRSRPVKKLLKSFGLSKDAAKVIMAIDRADYSKGIPARLDAYEYFLRKYPQYREKVVLVVLANPTRVDVQEYQLLRDEIEKKVSRINGEFATIDWTPIKYRYQFVDFDEVNALYALADVMLVTPHRDGMNLIAKEYIAAKQKSNGVLVLSEMAGAASEMSEAIIVNPNHIAQVANAINKALEMPKKEQKKRMRILQSRVSVNNIEKWANDFMDSLKYEVERNKQNPKLLSNKTNAKLLKDYTNANRRLVLLDYDGTLRKFVNSPDTNMARPSKLAVGIVRELAKDEKNKVVVISGRLRIALESYFDVTNLGMVAEHGGWVFDAGKWIKASVTNKKWKKPIKSLLENTARRTPGSVVEEKDFSLVWHYRQVPPDLAYVRKEELKRTLAKVIDKDQIGIFDGNKILEVKPKKMNKGAIVTEMLSNEKWDFILVIGDDYTDEDMFKMLPERAYSIRVGEYDTNAKYQIEDVKNVLELLGSLTKLSK